MKKLIFILSLLITVTISFAQAPTKRVIKVQGINLSGYATKPYADSLFALGYTKSQVDSLIADGIDSLGSAFSYDDTQFIGEGTIASPFGLNLPEEDTRVDARITLAGLTTATAGITPTLTMGNGGGTSPTNVSVVGNSFAGIIKMTTGTSPTLGGDIVVVTFSSSFSAKPRAIILGAGSTAAAQRFTSIYVLESSVSTTGFTIKNVGSALTAATNYYLYYHVIL